METKTITVTLTVAHDAYTDEALFDAVGSAIFDQNYEPEVKFSIEEVIVEGNTIYSLG